MKPENDCARIKIGVMGSAGGQLEGPLVERCKEMGRAIADSGCAIVTGGRPRLATLCRHWLQGKRRSYHWRKSGA